MVFQMIQQVRNKDDRSILGIVSAGLKVFDLATTIIMILGLKGIYSMAQGILAMFWP